MKKSNKILLFIVSLASLALSIGLLSLFYPNPIPLVTGTVASFTFLIDIFAGYVALLCLCSFLLLLAAVFSPVKSRDLVLIKSKGKLHFSRQAIESTVRCSFADVGGINFSKVRAKINKRPEKTRIYVKLSLNDTSRLAGVTETIQDKIESSLEASLGIAVKSIDIKVVEFNTEARKENTGDTAKNSRVE